MKWVETNSIFSSSSTSDSQFLDYWNLKQVIMLEGNLELSKSSEDLYYELTSQDLNTKIEFLDVERFNLVSKF